MSENAKETYTNLVRALIPMLEKGWDDDGYRMVLWMFAEAFKELNERVAQLEHAEQQRRDDGK